MRLDLGGAPLPELKGSILLLCSGNICRSPAAEALLAQALGALPVAVESAGLIAGDGLAMQDKMVSALSNRIDPALLRRFRSRRVTKFMLTDADLVLTATRSQRADIVRIAPSAVRNSYTLMEFAELASDVAVLLAALGEPRPHTIADFVELIPQVRGTRQLKGPLDIGDPMGRSARVHSRVARQIDVAVTAIARALVPKR